ncbi:GIY-YIG nuclease family protein [Autumnicola psychrophila]|uniref:GIY-YIG catalytic domain-containing protein n=1 Tax=Autumnicola psychrophila TaxID=3075592 RepID=A0ABU3DPC1_9FLAO|nr:hypothetical protein [Zunongwangia sp. F225]MDT0685567.1 hypothetical protein [Zunongwangia sp. F225]
MKGDRKFSVVQIEEIKKLVFEKENALPNQQKKIRDKIRKIGFYYSDFSPSKRGYTVQDVENLIAVGEIEVIGDRNPKSQPLEKTRADNSTDIIILEEILSEFRKNCFDPKVNSESTIPHASGNYIMCLKEGSSLPVTAISPFFKSFDHYKVIYTGIAGKSLRTRIFRTHFYGNNAGRSTLRKSLGVLFGYKLIPRDSDPTSGKTKFSQVDEKELSNWLSENILMFFYQTENCHKLEEKLIEEFNPPLNLDANKSEKNKNFRVLLSQLRNSKN